MSSVRVVRFVAAASALLGVTAACGPTTQPPGQQPSRPAGAASPTVTAPAAPDPGLKLIEHSFFDFRQYTVKAPFDGRIEMLEADQRGQRLGIVSASHANWILLFFHTDPAPGLQLGSTVTGGQTVGYGNLTGGGGNFDVALKWSPGGNSQEERWDFPILHLTDPVAADFAQHGLTPDTTVVSMSARDAAPCHEFRHSADNWTVVRQQD